MIALTQLIITVNISDVWWHFICHFHIWKRIRAFKGHFHSQQKTYINEHMSEWTPKGSKSQKLYYSSHVEFPWYLRSYFKCSITKTYFGNNATIRGFNIHFMPGHHMEKFDVYVTHKKVWKIKRRLKHINKLTDWNTSNKISKYLLERFIMVWIDK